MDPKNVQPAKNNMLWIWIALLGGFVVIVILITMLLYKSPITNTSNTEQTIEEEIESVELDGIDSDLQKIQKDVDQL